MEDLIRPRSYSCFNCRNHISHHHDIISKDFQSANGRAFMFYNASNVETGPAQKRRLITGGYIVSDVFCSDCGKILGWKYIEAFAESQKYKEGKVVLEKFKIMEDDP